MREFLDVDPRILRCPSRPQGPDQDKLDRQLRLFGGSSTGMPPINVTRCKDSELEILDGVTRAYRIARECPGEKELVEVSDERLHADITRYPRIGDFLP